MGLKITYEIARRVEGPLDAVVAAEAGPIPALADVLQVMRDLAFTVETVAHLQGEEQALLPTADRARALIKQLEGGAS